MAEVRVRGGDVVLTELDAIQAFIEPYGLVYQKWDVSKLSRDTVEYETEEARVLGVFSEEIEQLKASGGYTTADVIALSPKTPNLDAILGKFDREHLHSEDEVRFVVEGRGIFTVHNDKDDCVFDIEVHPGDLLVVPINTWHWFQLCEDQTIKCIRLFHDMSGWTPEYREGGMKG